MTEKEFNTEFDKQTSIIEILKDVTDSITNVNKDDVNFYERPTLRWRRAFLDSLEKRLNERL